MDEETKRLECPFCGSDDIHPLVSVGGTVFYICDWCACTFEEPTALKLESYEV